VIKRSLKRNKILRRAIEEIVRPDLGIVGAPMYAMAKVEARDTSRWDSRLPESTAQRVRRAYIDLWSAEEAASQRYDLTASDRAKIAEQIFKLTLERK